jgi:hypothetical protein
MPVHSACTRPGAIATTIARQIEGYRVLRCRSLNRCTAVSVETVDSGPTSRRRADSRQTRPRRCSRSRPKLPLRRWSPQHAVKAPHRTCAADDACFGGVE